MIADPANDQQFARGAQSCHFAEDQRAPRQSPKLVGIGKRNSAPDADVFCRVLLEQVADDPAEAAKKRPEQHGPGSMQLSDQIADTAIG
jgi:hypothetical protein